MCIGLQQNERSLLKIKAFYLRLSVSDAQKPLPDSLTLHFLPRINGSPLDINGSRIRPDSPAFVTLHRVFSGESAAGAGAAIFWSRERVRACEGVRFDVYLREEKALRGIFRRDESTGEWRMECKCALEREMVGVEVTEAEVCVAVEGLAAAMSEKVKMEVAMMRRRRRSKYCFQRLEEIPEQREVDTESDGCCCCCSEVGSNGGDFKEDDVEVDADLDVDMDGLRWAVDVGIWVVCLGVGYLVSKASSRSLRGKRLL